MGKEIQPITSNQKRQRQKFDKAFKLSSVALLKAGQKPATQLALELGIRRNLLYKWAETLGAHGDDVNTAFNGLGHNKLGKPRDPKQAMGSDLSLSHSRSSRRAHSLAVRRMSNINAGNLWITAGAVTALQQNSHRNC